MPKHAVSVKIKEPRIYEGESFRKTDEKSEMMESRLKRLKRSDLLEILIAQQKEIESLKAALQEKEELLRERQICIEDAGSIAEASLKLTQVFEQAQQAADLYLENIEIQEAAAKHKYSETLHWCEEIKRQTRAECERLIRETCSSIREKGTTS